MDLSRLLRPRSIAVVGATDRPDELRRAGAVEPGRGRLPGPGLGRESAPYLGARPAVRADASPTCPRPSTPWSSRSRRRACRRRSRRPAPADAAARSCSAPGSPRSPDGVALAATTSSRRRGVTTSRCAGPNCNGIVAMHARTALWGDALTPREPGAVALISQSGNVAVNALATRRGLRFHTVVASGNQAVLQRRRLSGVPGRRSRGRGGCPVSRGRRRPAVCATASPRAPRPACAWSC